MLKVLLVDDSHLVGKLLELYLENSGYDLDYCRTPFGVLSKVKEFRPDVVLLDPSMPGMSGKLTAGMIKASDFGAGCKTIIFSTEDEGYQRKMVEEGLADAYFVKRSSLDGLKDVINSVLNPL